MRYVKGMCIPGNCNLIHDPIENLPKYADIMRRVDEEVDEILGDDKEFFGICHRAWNLKKQLLKEQYEIDWHTPDELNPGCCFD